MTTPACPKEKKKRMYPLGFEPKPPKRLQPKCNALTTRPRIRKITNPTTVLRSQPVHQNSTVAKIHASYCYCTEMQVVLIRVRPRGLTNGPNAKDVRFTTQVIQRRYLQWHSNHVADEFSPLAFGSFLLVSVCTTESEADHTLPARRWCANRNATWHIHLVNVLLISS